MGRRSGAAPEQSGAAIDAALSSDDKARVTSAEQAFVAAWGLSKGNLDFSPAEDWQEWQTLAVGTRLYLYHLMAEDLQLALDGSDSYKHLWVLPFVFEKATAGGTDDGVRKLKDWLLTLDPIYLAVTHWDGVLNRSSAFAAAAASLTAAMTAAETKAFADLETAWKNALYVDDWPVLAAEYVEWLKEPVGVRLLFYVQAAENGDRTGATVTIANTLPALFANYYKSPQESIRKYFWDGADKMLQFYQPIAARIAAGHQTTTGGTTAAVSGSSGGGGLGVALLAALALLLGGKKK